eukprot:7657228-Alexandrium_andersonii.AAC.1
MVGSTRPPRVAGSITPPSASLASSSSPLWAAGSPTPQAPPVASAIEGRLDLRAPQGGGRLPAEPGEAQSLNPWALLVAL